MTIRFCTITIVLIFFLGLLPIISFADEPKDGPSKRTPIPENEIITNSQEQTLEDIQAPEVTTTEGQQEKEAGKTKVNTGKLAKEEKVKPSEKASAEKIYFSSKSFGLNADARKTLDDMAKWLKDNPKAALIIEGHSTDYTNTERNLVFGELRAGSVKTYLIKQGIDETRLTVVSYGAERSKERKASQKYRVKNWRVCFLVSDKKIIKAEEKAKDQEESAYAQPVKKESEVKEAVKTQEEKQEAPEKAEKENAAAEEKETKDSAKVEEQKEPVQDKHPQEDTKIAEAKEPEMNEGSPEGNKIEEAKKFFEKFAELSNNHDPKILDLYSEYAVIYMAGGSAAGQNQNAALIMEKAGPILLEALSKAKAQNTAIDFSDVKYTLEGKKVRIRSTRNSKPHSMIIGKNANNEWKIEEEVLALE